MITYSNNLIICLPPFFLAIWLPLPSALLQLNPQHSLIFGRKVSRTIKTSHLYTRLFKEKIGRLYFPITGTKGVLSCSLELHDSSYYGLSIKIAPSEFASQDLSQAMRMGLFIPNTTENILCEDRVMLTGITKCTLGLYYRNKVIWKNREVQIIVPWKLSFFIQIHWGDRKDVTYGIDPLK